MNVLFSHQIKKGFGIQWVKCILAWWRIFESTTHFGCLGKHMTCRMERSQWYQASTKHGMHWSNTVAWQVTGLVCPDGWCKQGNITKHAPSYQRSSTFWQILQGRSDIVVTSLAALIHDLCRINWKYVEDKHVWWLFCAGTMRFTEAIASSLSDERPKSQRMPSFQLHPGFHLSREGPMQKSRYV